MTATAQPENIAASPAYWTHKVEAFPSPVAQFRMAQLVDLDDRLYENARIVYRFLVGWYHDGHGDALLSMRHVSKVLRARAPEGAAILSHSVVQRAVIALMETGWVVRTYKGRGKGRGASRFVPVMNVLELASQGKFPELSHSSGTVELSHSGGTVVSHSSGTLAAELSHSIGPKTLLRDPPTGGATERENEPAPPTAPLSVGLSATDAEGAGGGFDELWKAYGARRGKPEARAAYLKAAPDSDTHRAMVDAADAWFAAWQAQGKADAPRFTLAKWLEREEYECDPPTAFKPKERKAKQKNLPKPANDNVSAEGNDIPDWMVGSPKLWPKGRHHGQFIEGKVESKAGDTEIQMTFQRDDGKLFRHHFFVEAFIEDEKIKGRDAFRSILRAMDITSTEDTDDLLFKPIAVVADGVTLTYLNRAEAA